MFSKISLLLIISLNSIIFAQYNGNRFSVFAGFDYITSAQIFLNPNSSDIFLRNSSFEINNLYSPIVDFRYRLNDDLILGLNTEYISKSQTGNNLSVKEGSQEIKLDVADGVMFIPIEFSLHYYLPFSTDQFKFTMGLGVGYNLGKQTRKFGNTEIETISRRNSMGILVTVGVEYLITDQFGARFNMKFRDPEIELTNRYKNSIIDYNGTQVQLSSDTFNSKINLDGISFIIGMVIHF